MAKRGVSVGVEITGDAKSYKKAAEGAAKATAELKRQATAHAKEVKQSFEMTTIALAKIGAVALVAKEGFEVYAKVMNSTEGTSEKLEQQISLLDGAMSGLMRTIATGSWDSLISNITQTAEATRDAKSAMQEFEHASAGRTITRGELNIGLQEARVNAGEATNPKDKAKYLTEAVDLQKQITALNVSEISQRLNIDEEYYKKLTGHSKEYFDYFLKMVPTLAQNYDHYFGAGSTEMEGIKTRLAALKFDVFPSDKTKSEIHQLMMLKDVMEDYITVQDDLSKKGQWDNYIKGIGEMKEAAAQGEKALVRLVKQLTVAQQSSLPVVKQIGPIPVSIGGKNDKEFARSIGELTGQAPGLQAWDTTEMKKIISEREEGIRSLEKMTTEMNIQQEVAGNLSNVFSSMFSNMDKGWKGMADGAIQAIERIVAELLAKEAVLLLMNVLFPGSGTIMGTLSGLFGGGSMPGFASGTNYAPGGLAMVGERGPELVNMPKGSKVTPYNKLGNGTLKIKLSGGYNRKDLWLAVKDYDYIMDQNT